jgi:hypothetical protein
MRRLDFGDWSDRLPVPAGQLREQRSRLTGLGARPALHPAWRAPSEADSDGKDEAGPVPGSGAR